MIAHADVQKPSVLRACHEMRLEPCFVTMRALLPSGHYRYYRLVLRRAVVGTTGFASLAP